MSRDATKSFILHFELNRTSRNHELSLLLSHLHLRYARIRVSVHSHALCGRISCAFKLARLAMSHAMLAFAYTVETLYSTIYYSKYFIELNFDKSTHYVAL